MQIVPQKKLCNGCGYPLRTHSERYCEKCITYGRIASYVDFIRMALQDTELN